MKLAIKELKAATECASQGLGIRRSVLPLLISFLFSHIVSCVGPSRPTGPSFKPRLLPTLFPSLSLPLLRAPFSFSLSLPPLRASAFSLAPSSSGLCFLTPSLLLGPLFSHSLPPFPPWRLISGRVNPRVQFAQSERKLFLFVFLFFYFCCVLA